MTTKNGNPVAEKIDYQNLEAGKKKTLTITLRSSDDQEFLVSESAAVLSLPIKNVVEYGCCAGSVLYLSLEGKTLAKVITYLNKHVDDGVSDEEKRKFEEFVSRMEFDILFHVVLAANYLNIKDLFDIVCQKIADTLNKDVRWARKTFWIEMKAFCAESRSGPPVHGLGKEVNRRSCNRR